MSISEALEYINSVCWKGSVPGLERITELMHKLGDPQKKLKFIHIAGTNGKGSTAAFTSSILVKSGLKVGLYISPFIEVFNERMQINNHNISDEELAEIVEYIKPFADSMEDAPTEFELYTAIALVYFERNKCDVVVFEVGMGGEFDATNVIDTPVISVIVAIGLDHTAYLGDTVEKIAATKAGIIKPGSDVVLYKQNESITNVIKERCESIGSKLYISEPEKLTTLLIDIDKQIFRHTELGNLMIPLIGSYQKMNLAVVLKIVEVLKNKGYKITDDDIVLGLISTKWPGRFEVLSRDPVFVVDGAHNPHGILAAAEGIHSIFHDKKLIFLFGVMADKDYDMMLDQILPMAKEVFCVVPGNARALDNHKSAKLIESKGVKATAIDTVELAVDEAFKTAGKDDVIFAIGSLYMIGDIKKYFSNK